MLGCCLFCKQSLHALLTTHGLRTVNYQHMGLPQRLPAGAPHKE